MSDSDFTAIILAAGKGTRMHSATPKVLHTLAGRAMLGYVLAAAQEAGAKQICLVTAPNQNSVRDYADTQMDITHCLQKKQNGTGDAVAVAMAQCNHERVVVLFGDTPMLGADVLRNLANTKADVAVMGFEPDDPAQYGRIIMKDNNPTKIIEYKDADEITRAIPLCNGGAMSVRRDVLQDLLPQLQNDNAQGEYYLPDIVGLAHTKNHTTTLIMASPQNAQGVDSRAGLAAAEALIQKGLRRKHLLAGVGMQDPTSVFLSYDTRIAPDVFLEPNIQINTGVSIGAGSVIKSFSHLEGVVIGANVQVGPFARLRPDTNIKDNARIGNFVEIKKADIGVGSKVSHLSYIGDARLGSDVNIGAGVITCNYDGETKHLTQIEDGAFVGSNSSLIAPITIGAKSYIGSGSSLSKNVAARSLALTRAPLREIKNYTKNKKAKK